MAKSAIILSGDIGGTNTRLQLTEFSSKGEMKALTKNHYLNNEHTDFIDIIQAFLKEAKVDIARLTNACFAVAGPIIDEEVKFTNLSWKLSAQYIKAQLKLSRVHLINDFLAIGYGIETLNPADLYTLQTGNPETNGVKAFIGAGTGLGAGFMVYNQNRYIVHASEGGHVDFAPADELQVELWRYLNKKYHHVSYERVLSGPGLVNIYSFARDNKIVKATENKALLNLTGDSAKTIALYATQYQDPIAMRTLEIFLNIYGATVGNLALTTLPYGGLYIVGGIAPKLLPEIQSSHFLASFSDKGRMGKLLKKIPLYIVLDPDVGLRGAAIYSAHLL